jgi:hypothetical protein
MLRSRFVAAAIGFAVTLAVGSVEATQGCGDVGLTGEHFGTCSPSKRGPIPGTLEELLQALDQRLPQVLRDRCTEDKDSMCDCTLERELWNCWSFSATRTPLVKWFSDGGVATSDGMAELLIVWLKRRIHGQDLRISKEIARYLAANEKREVNYKLGVGSRGLSWRLGDRDDTDGFIHLHIGEGVPWYERFLFYMVEHAERKLVDCWRMIPLRHPGFDIEVSMRLSIVPETKKWIARIEKSTLPAEYGECMARAVSGVELPDYGPGPYEVTISDYRETRTWSLDDYKNLGPSKDRRLWLGLGVGLAAIVAVGLLVRRRLRKTS